VSSLSRFLLPFAAGVAVGVLVHKYWPQIRELGGPVAKRGLKSGAGLFDRVKTSLAEQGEKFADLVAEIREEEEAAGKAPPTP
jgi:hypothetical protein